MNGTRVDFGTLVRDLSWSPDGRKAAFVDGDGDLAVAAPDGSGRVVVARNPGGQTWSHPTWQTRKADAADGMPALNNLIFAAGSNGTGGTPRPISLNHEAGDHPDPLPTTGNVWPNAGSAGSAVYANPGTGKVYIRDDNIRQQGSALTAGSEPALSSQDDADIVFVRSVDGHDHLFLEHSTDSGPTYKDLTPHASTDYTEPAFSPAGDRIAARTPAGIVELPADGSGGPVRVSGYKGLPAYRHS
jgi:Tol biopolymer transport system component